MKLPTKAQWDEMAEAFYVPINERNERQRLYTGYVEIEGATRLAIFTGICYAIRNLTDESWNWFSNAMNPDEGGWWWPLDNAGDRQRAFFCCMMAAITESGDMESMIGGE